MLLSPLGSNVVVRTACCSVGIVLPVYSTFKAIEGRDADEQHKWLVYWAAYGSFSIVEMFTDKFIYWFPLYYHMKFAFLVWLQLPTVDGAKQLYANHLRPFLLKHQGRLDKVVDLLYGEMSKLISNHQVEIQFVRAIVMKMLTSANQLARDTTHPPRVHVAGTIEGPTQQLVDGHVPGAVESSDSEYEE